MRIILKKLKVLLFLTAILISATGYAQVKTIKGKVTDALNGEALPGVSVVVKGTTKGAATNFDGQYTLDVEANQTLIFSFIGYTPKEMAVGSTNEINASITTRTTINLLIRTHSPLLTITKNGSLRNCH